MKPLCFAPLPCVSLPGVSRALSRVVPLAASLATALVASVTLLPTAAQAQAYQTVELDRNGAVKSIPFERTQSTIYSHTQFHGYPAPGYPAPVVIYPGHYPNQYPHPGVYHPGFPGHHPGGVSGGVVIGPGGVSGGVLVNPTVRYGHPGAYPYGVQPYGVRPHGVRPYGVRPYGVQPYGVRPYGVRPYGVRPHSFPPVIIRQPHRW
jgi:hypothetical protein